MVTRFANNSPFDVGQALGNTPKQGSRALRTPENRAEPCSEPRFKHRAVSPRTAEEQITRGRLNSDRHSFSLNADTLKLSEPKREPVVNDKATGLKKEKQVKKQSQQSKKNSADSICQRRQRAKRKRREHHDIHDRKYIEDMLKAMCLRADTDETCAARLTGCWWPSKQKLLCNK
eukprot:COSAG05_NODE_2271_length_3302_cov_5923.304090_3_plen_175_part_00